MNRKRPGMAILMVSLLLAGCPPPRETPPGEETTVDIERIRPESEFVQALRQLQTTISDLQEAMNAEDYRRFDPRLAQARRERERVYDLATENYQKVQISVWETSLNHLWDVRQEIQRTETQVKRQFTRLSRTFDRLLRYLRRQEEENKDVIGEFEDALSSLKTCQEALFAERHEEARTELDKVETFLEDAVKEAAELPVANYVKKRVESLLRDLANLDRIREELTKQEGDADRTFSNFQRGIRELINRARR